MKRLLWVVLALLLFDVSSMPGQVPSIPVSIACGQQALNSTLPDAYSGPFVLFGRQYGILAVNAQTGAVQFKNGVGKPEPGNNCGFSVSFVGDCWQSVVGITATNGTPKWLLTTGAPSMCMPGGLTVFKFSGSSFSFVKQIPIVHSYRGAPAVLDGDTAYVRLNQTIAVPVSYVRCDLDALTCDPTVLTSIPAGEGRQSSVGGFTYSANQIDMEHYTVYRNDLTIPTAPPMPTSTALPAGVTKPAPTHTMVPAMQCCDYPNCPPVIPIPPCKTATRVPPTKAPTIPPTSVPSVSASSTPYAPPTLTPTPVPVVAIATPVPTPAKSCWLCGCVSAPKPTP